MTDQPLEFLRVPLADGGVRVRLDRLTDGRVMCQLCFDYFPIDALNPVQGGVEDVCKPCAAEDRRMALVRLPRHALVDPVLPVGEPGLERSVRP